MRKGQSSVYLRDWCVLVAVVSVVLCVPVTEDCQDRAAAPIIHSPVHSSSNASILFCDAKELCMLNLESRQETILASNFNYSAAVDYDYARQIVVGTDYGNEWIFSVPISSSGSKNDIKILEAGVKSYGIAVDWIRGNVYWTDIKNKVISMTRLDAVNSKKDLVTDQLYDPEGIVLDPRQGFMYWSNQGSVPKIEKSGMDGSNRKTIANESINALSIDIPSRRLFWISKLYKNLCSCGLEGEDLQVVIGYSPHIYTSLDVYEDYVYWVGWDCSIKIFKAQKTTGSNVTAVYVLVRTNNLEGIKIYHPSKQEINRRDHAAAPIKHSLVNSSPNTTLLYCNTLDLRMLNLSSGEETVVAKFANHSIAVDYDYARQIVVWTDIGEQQILSASISSSGSRNDINILASGVTSYGIAVDWIRGNVYWTDTKNNVISVSRLDDGNSKKDLVTDQLYDPRAIALDPREGFMYWSNQGSEPKIEKSEMDGKNRRTIASESIDALSIDIPSRRLFWISQLYKNLCSCGLEGEDLQVVIGYSPYIYSSLDVYEDYVYWTGWDAGVNYVFMAQKTTGSNLTSVFDANQRKMEGIKVYHPSKQEITPNACGKNNGGCSHLCLPSPLLNGPNHTCACPNGMQLQTNGVNCLASQGIRKKDINKAISFNGTTILRLLYPQTNSSRRTKSNQFQVRFRTTHPSGLLFWTSKSGKLSSDFLAIALKGGYPEMVFGFRGHRERCVVTSDRRVDDGLWHSVTFYRKKRFGEIRVDNNFTVSNSSTSGTVDLHTGGTLWIGGYSSTPYGLPSDYYSGFIGCIDSIVVDKASIHHILSSKKNIEFCS